MNFTMRDLYNHPRIQTVTRSLLQHAVILGSIILLLWLTETVDQLVWGGQLDQFGIHPRSWLGLRNLLLSPFLHGGFGHLFANTFPFLVLGWFVLLRGGRTFIAVSLIAAVCSGLGVWVFGSPNTVHVGISGVVFGYLGYLLLRGYFERSASAIALALLAFLLYGGMFWGVLPLRDGVSWLGHLFGFIGGGLAAYALARPAGPARRPMWLQR